MSDSNAKRAAALDALSGVIDRLIGPDGCPWDQEQTPLTLCDYLAEETFELIEGIRSGDLDEIMEEMGDVAFLLLFISTLYERDCDITLEQSLRHNAAKMIRRHPHVFGDKDFNDIDELWDNWERTKREEKKDKEGPKRVFGSLPKGLPPLLKAYRINSKAARNRFTWDTDEEVLAQMHSEWQEFEAALESDDKNRQEEEFGDYLFTMVEYGRRKGFKANGALDRANRKFLDRFEKMEDLAAERGLDLAELDMQAKNHLWDEVKGMLK